jgi:hypothetical protein
LGVIAGLAAAVALWFGWIYYTELRVEGLEAQVRLLDIEVKAKRLLAEAPPVMLRLSKGPDRAPSEGRLGQVMVEPRTNLWKARVRALVQSYPELIRENLPVSSTFWDRGLLLVLTGEPKAAVTVLSV